MGGEIDTVQYKAMDIDTLRSERYFKSFPVPRPAKLWRWPMAEDGKGGGKRHGYAICMRLQVGGGLLLDQTAVLMAGGNTDRNGYAT